MALHSALREYQTTSTAGGFSDRTPHQLIAALYEGSLERLGRARTAIMRGDTRAKIEAITSVMAILDHLRLCLDTQRGGDLAQRLEALYDYMTRRLLEANLRNDVEAINETAQLMRTIKSGWDGIAPH